MDRGWGLYIAFHLLGNGLVHVLKSWCIRITEKAGEHEREGGLARAIVAGDAPRPVTRPQTETLHNPGEDGYYGWSDHVVPQRGSVVEVTLQVYGAQIALRNAEQVADAWHSGRRFGPSDTPRG
jgi:hypothetical protein